MARILVVDDTPNIRKMVRLTLERVGHEVQLAADGTEGLQLFGDGSAFDLTIVDQQMPGLEGQQLIAEARKRDPQARLMMMTAFASSELASEVLQSGALDFLRKPFSTDTLRNAVNVALQTPRFALESEGEIVNRKGDSAADAAVLPAPGEADFVIPRLSYRFNGYAFWPLPEAFEGEHPPGIEFGRSFQVRHPDDHLSRCFVGVTAHVRHEATAEDGRELAPDDLFWEKLCGVALLHFLWEKVGPPPAVLPVYEMPKTRR